MIEAVLSSTQHPEYGEVSISFPILRKEYDHTIELLEGLGIGDALAQDCRVGVFIIADYNIIIPKFSPKFSHCRQRSVMED